MKVKFSLSVVSFLFLFIILVGFVLYNNSPTLKISGKRNIHETNRINSSGYKALIPFATLSESFESTTFPPSGWIKITPTTGTGWNRQITGTTPIPGTNSGYIIAPTGGGTAVAFCNYLTGSNPPGHGPSNQWLISPKLGNIQPDDSLSFWLRKFGHYLDHFKILISTTTPTISAMTVVVDTITFYPNDSGFIFHKYNIGNLVPAGSNIYIGFREWVDSTEINGATFSLDLVKSTAQVVEVSNNSQMPDNYNLSQNYPNPFNPTTNINYSVAKKGFVSLSVYDILGKEVGVLVNEIKNAGNYTVIFNASKLSSGVYYYKIQSGIFSDLKFMILIK